MGPVMADRIEREIEDILNKLDDFVPEKGQKPIPFRRRSRKSPSQSWLSKRLARISLNQVMVYALVVLIVAFILRGLPFVSWVMIGAGVVLLSAFLLSLRGGGSRSLSGGSTYQKRWRGEPIDIPDPYAGPSLGDRIVAWFRRRK